MRFEYPPQRPTPSMSTTALYKGAAASAAGGANELASASVINGNGGNSGSNTNGILSRMSSSSSTASVTTTATPMVQGESIMSTRNVAGSPPAAGAPPPAQSRVAAGAGGIAEHFPDDDTFRMFEFKVRKCPCTRPHDWTQCPFVHPGERARRRCPKKFNYSATPCPDFKRGACKKGDACEFAHGVFEVNLHPTRYRTSMCTEGANCTRKICFFAHKPSQLRYVDGGNSTPQGLPASVQLQLAQSLEECHNSATTAAAAAAASVSSTMSDQIYCPPATMDSSNNGVSAQPMMSYDNGSSTNSSSSNSISQMCIVEHISQQQVPPQPPPPQQQQQQQHAMLMQQQQQQQHAMLMQQQQQQQQHMSTAAMEHFTAGLLSASAGNPALPMRGHERVPLTSRQASSESIVLNQAASEHLFQAEYNAQLISAINRAFAPPTNASRFHMNRSRSELALDENLVKGQCMVDDLVM